MHIDGALSNCQEERAVLSSTTSANVANSLTTSRELHTPSSGISELPRVFRYEGLSVRTVNLI
jgi:hypothetical protein